METKEILMFLLDEGVDVWRPVQAIPRGGDLYEIPASTVVPEDEAWQFQPGETVRCREQSFENRKKGLAAFERV